MIDCLNIGPHGEKVGDRVTLIECTDEYTYLPPGLNGTVSYIDDKKTLFIDWENGSKLGLVHGYDRWYFISGTDKN